MASQTGCRLRSRGRGVCMARSHAVRPEEGAVSLEQTLNDEERLADLDLDQLKQLVGLVEYDAATDPFPVTGWDALVWVVGNADADRALLPVGLRHGAGRLLRARRPATATTTPTCCESGAARFVLTGAVDPASPLADHHRAHGDGIVDIALEVPDVDRCIAHAARAGRDRPRGAARRHRRARHGADRPRSPPTATPGTRWSTGRATPARTCPATSRGRRPSCRADGRAEAALPGRRPRRRQRRARPHGRVGRLLQPGHGLHEHGRVRRRRHRHRVLAR